MKDRNGARVAGQNEDEGNDKIEKGREGRNENREGGTGKTEGNLTEILWPWKAARGATSVREFDLL